MASSWRIVDRVTLTLPFLGSLIPAIMTFESASQQLKFHPVEAGIIGVVVAGLGFTGITTALDALEQLGPRSKQFWVALAGTAVYVAAVLVVNAILGDGDITQKVALALLAVLADVGGVMVAVRKQLVAHQVTVDASNASRAKQAEADERERLEREQREWLDREQREREEREHQRRMAEKEQELMHQQKLAQIEAESRRSLAQIRAEGRRRVPEKPPEPVAPPGEQGPMYRSWAEVPRSDYEFIASAPVGEIVTHYRLGGKDPARTARAWKASAKAAMDGDGGQNASI